ncbi:hypothetical protein KW795_02345, partial [Candidatus Microgenomates bacterium]|nr:hypothetical protein [Candidatus Microgenomates bacterium]
MRYIRSRKPKGKIAWREAQDIKDRVDFLIDEVELGFNKNSIYTRRSINANTRAYARIWGLSRLWQETLNLKPSYS